MTAAPVVIRSRSTPFLSVACAVLVVYFVVKALLLDGGPAVFSLLLGAAVAVTGLWWLWRAGQRAVVIDGDQLIIRSGQQSRVYSRAEIVSIDLSSLDRQIMFTDGSGIRLPLEGRELIEAGFLLTPPRRYRAV
ncbi:MAG: hypothetical protein OEZ14_10085 [Acidimicrobiia bacterium]|nr:hypothetical protein [Acidimicrobiia bacterium]